jgi:ElaB/YqjD/DUF883 family membrane-anchored ribosome-binding protein
MGLAALTDSGPLQANRSKAQECQALRDDYEARLASQGAAANDATAKLQATEEKLVKAGQRQQKVSLPRPRHMVCLAASKVSRPIQRLGRQR